MDDRINTKFMLRYHYKDYSQSRIETMRSILVDYGIDYKDSHQLDLLIETAKAARSERDYYSTVEKPFKAGYTIITLFSSIITSVINVIIDDLEKTDLIYYMLQIIFLALLVYIMYLCLDYLLKIILQSECKIYDDFISDVQQIKLFKGRLYP